MKTYSFKAHEIGTEVYNSRGNKVLIREAILFYTVSETMEDTPTLVSTKKVFLTKEEAEKSL